MDVKIEEGWKEKLKQEFDKPYFEYLSSYVKSEASKYAIFPPGKFIFNAFERCPFDKG